LLESKLRKAEIQNAELEAKEQSTREQLAEVQNDKTQLENDLNQKMGTVKKTYERELEEMQ